VTLDLDGNARHMLAGGDGPAMQLAMELVAKAATIMGAERLIPISFAHIDACFYTGQAHVDFARFLVENSARLGVPTWTNNGVVSLADPALRPPDEDPETASGAATLMQLYARLGCRPTWTCAPYQIAGGPRLGDQIAAGESNAVSYYNSVTGARTNKYGAYLDVACALTGLAPDAGLHRERQAFISMRRNCRKPGACPISSPIWPAIMSAGSAAGAFRWSPACRVRSPATA